MRKLLTSLLLALLLFVQLPVSETFYEKVVYKSEFVFDYDLPNNKWIIDKFNDGTTDIALKFGASGAGEILFNSVSNQFTVTDNLSLSQNELKDVAIDNLSSAPLSPVPGQIYYNTTDNNTYVWNSFIWEDITAVGATVDPKVITVGTGQDYATIGAGAAYLNSAGGGIMLLSAESFAVTSSINLANIAIYGKGETKTTIAVSGGGQIDVSDTTFNYLHLDTNSITDDMGLDLLSGTSSLQFEFVRISVQDSGDSLIDSNAVTAPTVQLHFVNCEFIAESGTVLKTEGLSNINTASSIQVYGANGTGSLDIRDWDVTLEGEANVFTSGIITTIPSNTIFVYPGMNLQGAINSLPSGGIITLLPGTHAITQPLQILNDNLTIRGYGGASIISASGFTGITTDTAAIEVGANNGTNPSQAVELTDFTLNVSGNIHGIRVAGGSDNKVTGVTVRKVSGQGGSGTAAKIGIQFLDSTAAQLVRASIRGNRIEGNGGTNYFTDGIHMTALSGTGGIWGFNQGVTGSLIEGNVVDYVRETAYVIVRADSSNLFNNRATRMGVGGGGGAYGIYIGGATSVNMNANVFSGSLNTGTVAVGIEALGLNLTTSGSIFNNNVIDGTGNGGVGFATGFQIGAAANAQAHRNSFQNNIVSGADNTTTVAIQLRGNADDNTLSNNTLTGGTNSWDTGIEITAAAGERNSVESNTFTNVTTLITNTGTSTKFSTSHIRSTASPTVNDDRNDGFYVGSMWINTAADAAFILTNDTPGAANWVSTGGGGHTQNTDTGTNANTFILNNDGSAGNVTLQFGTILGNITYDTTNSRFLIDDPLRIEGNTTIVGQGFIAANDAAANSDGVLNLGRSGSTWQSLSFDSANSTFTTNNTQLTTRIRQSATPPFACTAGVSGTLWMDTDNGLLHTCDGVRTKWLTSPDVIMWGENTGTCNAGSDGTNSISCAVQWGGSLGADTATDLGFYLPYPATITGYSFSEDNDACTSGSMDVEIYASGSNADENNFGTTINIATGLNNQVHNANDLNIDVDGNQYIIWGIDNNCGQNIDDWNVILYLRWRS